MRIQNNLNTLGLSLSTEQCDQLSWLVDTHLKWNQTFNISAYRDETAVVRYQIMDSLSVHPWIGSGSLLDVGTGPGFPGLPLAICNPSLPVTLLDSNDKKLAFARHVAAVLQLKNVRILHRRIEDVPTTTQFEQIISRAFTDLSGMISKTLPLLADLGQILAMKGARVEAEVADAAQTHPNCCIEVHQVPHVVDEHRVLAVIKRI